MIVEVVLFFVLVYVYYAVKDRKPKGMPPGPLEIPFLGNAPLQSKDQIFKLQKKHGDIVTVRFGNLRSVVLFDYHQAKEAMASVEFVNRPAIFEAFSIDERKKGGVLFSNGEIWQQHRRFSLKNLRNLGMGKSFLETAIHTEAEALVEDLKMYEQKPINFPASLKTAPLNIIWQMVSGKRYDLNSCDVKAVYEAMERFRKEMGICGFLFMFFPTLKKIVPEIIQRKVFKATSLDDLCEEMRKVIEVELAEQEEKFAAGENEVDTLISQYLQSMEDDKDKTNFWKGSLVQTVSDLFGAGSDTVANMLRWVVYLMAEHPHLTREIQSQIDEFVPKGKLVSLEDKPNLPLVEAFTVEALRYSSMVPMNVQREAARDTTIAGYFVPKGTLVVAANVYIHHDTKIWENPDDFTPERFLTSEGKFKAPKEGFFAFGSGRRQCLGENLARMEFFLFTAALLQNFTIKLPEGDELLKNFDAAVGARTPMDQKFIYEIRK